ncbi:MAG: hypothetical protein LC808_11255 [Actinobacteria bacterium]|nr:hypothetical protein [Actinomycetota bacterium]
MIVCDIRPDVDVVDLQRAAPDNRREMPQSGTDLGVAEDVFDRGAVSVPVLDCGGFVRGVDVEVGMNE